MLVEVVACVEICLAVAAVLEKIVRIVYPVALRREEIVVPCCVNGGDITPFRSECEPWETALLRIDLYAECADDQKYEHYPLHRFQNVYLIPISGIMTDRSPIL